MHLHALSAEYFKASFLKLGLYKILSQLLSNMSSNGMLATPTRFKSWRTNAKKM